MLIKFSREIYRHSGLAIYVSVRREEENTYAWSGMSSCLRREGPRGA